MIRIYRAAISPALTVVFTPLGFGCRFRPTCSQYAADAIRAHGAWRGAALALRRVCRCHPWGGSGYDPVPDSAHVCRRRGNESLIGSKPSEQHFDNYR